MHSKSLYRRHAFTMNALLGGIALLGFGLALMRAVYSQPTFDAISTTPSLPEPVYWKQTLFLIPYQFATAAEPAAAQAVWLFISKDQGAAWQKISEAKPHVKSFNYRAESDGEYWFAIRTLDHQGRFWPTGSYQPELRVIVDTTMPRIEALQARIRPDGAVDIRWHGSDINLDAATWRIEAQTDIDSSWQAVAIEGAGTAGQGAGAPSTYDVLPGSNSGSLISYSSGESTWQPPSGHRPIAVRATVSDRAGNTATYCAPIESAPLSEQAVQRLPHVGAPNKQLAAPVPAPAPSQPGNGSLFVANASDPASVVPSWMPSKSASPPTQPVSVPPTEQSWPPDVVSRAPFRLDTSGGPALHDGVTAYGNPHATSPWETQTESRSDDIERSVPARFATAAETTAEFTGDAPVSDIGGRSFQPLQPYREAPKTPAQLNSTTSNAPPDVRPMFVGARTFALEYDVEQVGRSGISKVELWATRDGGQTWFRLSQDDDNRTPLVATVDEEGLYGFRLLVESAYAPATPPAAGDAPELWVAVDLQRPTAELTAIEPGVGNMSDHLILRWRTADSNLEQRPISLFYSSRPAGPWSAVATSLENTGEYAWRVERHVPARFYLRLEARDTAGNLAAFQTRDAIEFAPSVTNGRLRSAEPLDPTAVGDSAAYR